MNKTAYNGSHIENGKGHSIVKEAKSWMNSMVLTETLSKLFTRDLVASNKTLKRAQHQRPAKGEI